MAIVLEHDEVVRTMTGGMASNHPTFEGSERLRPNGRPTGAFRDELRKIPDVANAVTCLISVVLPILLIAVAVSADHWLGILLAIPVMGLVQNRMFILHHEGAHRLLFTNRKFNDFIGLNVFGPLSFGGGGHAYRRGHSNHHRDEFGPKEPDFLLYALFPVTGASFRRKLRRDFLGVSAYRQLKPRVVGVLNRRYAPNSIRFYVGQITIFSMFFLSGQPALYLLLWVLPYMTFYQVINRLRAIAEHGGMTRSGDKRQTSHHVSQSMLARIFLVPLRVGHHLAHHVDSGVPFRNLPKLTKALKEDGYIYEDLLWRSYPTLWRALAKSAG